MSIHIKVDHAMGMSYETMSTRHDMKQSLDHLKILSCDGIFENKEGWFSKKVAPEEQKPQTNVQEEESSEDLKMALANYSEQLRNKELRLLKKERELNGEKELLETEKGKFQGEVEQFKVKKRETDELNTKLQEEKMRYENIKTYIDDETVKFKYTRNALENEEEKLRLEKLNFSRNVKNQSKQNLSVFMCLCYDDIRDMIQRRKLRCIIPPQTTTWFTENIDKAGDLYEFLHSLNAELDIPSGDNLCIHVKKNSERIVVFFLKSRFLAFAQESWDGNEEIAYNKLHLTQPDDKYKVNEATLRR